MRVWKKEKERYTKKTGLTVPAKTSKILVFAQNFLFLAFGSALIGVAIYLLVNEASTKIFKDLKISYYIPVGMIVVGCFMELISFLGFFGSARLNRVMLAIYFIFLMLLVGGLITCSALSIKYANKIPSIVDQGWHMLTNSTVLWIEKQFHCCGFTPSESNSTYCHVLMNGNTTSCDTILVDWIQSKLLIVQVVSFLVAAVILCGAFLSCCLYCSIPSSSEVEEMEKQKLLTDMGLVHQGWYAGVK